MSFNTFVYFICFTFGGSACVLNLLDRRQRRSRKSAPFVQNQEFVEFRRRYFAAYLLCLFADSLQAPYLYYLYHSYGFLEYQIAILYVAGYVTNIVFSIVAQYLTERMDRKLLCMTYVGVCAVSCAMKFSTSYGLLLISRVIDGVCASLLTAPFQDWYVHQHVIKYDFPREWIAVTFRYAAVLTGYLAIGAGFIAEFAESLFKFAAIPFVLSIPVLIGAGLWISYAWEPNRLEKSLRRPVVSQLGRAIPVILRDPSVFILSAIQALFESCLYIFVFLWTPIFLHVGSVASPSSSPTTSPIVSTVLPSSRINSSRAAFGIVYSTFMASALCGQFVQRILNRRYSARNLLCLSLALSFGGLVIAVATAYPIKESVLKFEVLLLAFATYELGVGLYFPNMQRLQTEILPAEHRQSILSLFRIPLNLIAGCCLLLLHGHEMYGNWMLLIICMILMIVSVMLSLLLLGLTKRTSNVAENSDRFLFQLRGDGVGDEDDDL